MIYFKAAMLEVHGLDYSVTMSALKKGLKANSFDFSLLKRFFHDFTKLLVHVDKYINAKEGMAKKWKEKVE